MKKLLLNVLILSCVIFTTACGSSIDATAYVEASLNALYKGDYKAYADFRKLSDKEAQEEIEGIHRTQIAASLSSYEFTEEQIEEYTTLETSLYALAKYEVGEAVKDDNGNYVVPVTVYPCDVLIVLDENLDALTLEKMAADSDLDPTSSDVIYELLTESLELSIKDCNYGDVVSVDLPVVKDTDGLYGITDTDLEKLENALFLK